MLPLVKPGLATVSIFNFLGTWNEFVLAKTMIFSETKNTLAHGPGQPDADVNDIRRTGVRSLPR